MAQVKPCGYLPGKLKVKFWLPLLLTKLNQSM